MAELSAQCEANANLPLPLLHRVVEHSVQPNAGKQQGDRSKEKSQGCQQSLTDGLRLVQFKLRPDSGDVERRADTRHLAAKRRRQGKRIRRRGTNDEGSLVNRKQGCVLVTVMQ